MIKLGKRGVFYLLISSLFLVIIIFLFVAYKQYSYSDRQDVIKVRVMTINDFIKDIEFDSHRVIYVSGFRSLIAIEDYVAKTGQYLNNTEELFRIAFFNGTINNSNIEVLENSTYQDYLEKLQELSRTIGIEIDINVTNITLIQNTPWSVDVQVTTHVIINDTRNVVNWEFDKDYSTTVSLINIRDPLYSISTYGKVPNPIRRSNITDYVNASNNDTTGLQHHLNNSFYIENDLAPSFLMRLEGNFSPSPYGIESLVYVPELSIQGVAYDDEKSVVDYVFFTNITGYDITYCDVTNMPSWFIIDANHSVKYEINTLNYTICS